MRLREWQLEHLLRTTAILVTYYLDREQPRTYSIFHVTGHGESDLELATEALCRFVVDSRKDALRENAVMWTERSYEEALALATGAPEAGETAPHG